jgi:multiple sugar transport system substrate-binding protein
MDTGGYDLFNTHNVSPTGVPPEQTSEMFQAEQVAMFVGGEWNLLPFDGNENLDFGIAAHPYFADGRVATPTGSWHVGVSAFSQKKGEAGAFANFISSSSTGSLTWFERHGQFPAPQELRASIDESEDYSEFPRLSYRLGGHEARNTAVPRPKTPGYLELEDILASTLEDIRNGSQPEQALQSAVTRIDRALEKYQGL